MRFLYRLLSLFGTVKAASRGPGAVGWRPWHRKSRARRMLTRAVDAIVMIGCVVVGTVAGALVGTLYATVVAL